MHTYSMYNWPGSFQTPSPYKIICTDDAAHKYWRRHVPRAGTMYVHATFKPRANFQTQFNLRFDRMELELDVASITGSFQNQACDRQFISENEARVRPTQKRGIRAFLAEVTNQVDAPTYSTRASKESAAALLVSECKKEQRDPKKGVEVRMANLSNLTDHESLAQTPVQDANTTYRNDDSLFHIFKNNQTLFNKGRECLQGYININRHLTFEIK